MAKDQVHEKNNKLIKRLGGATSLLNTQDDSALRTEFEDSLYDQNASNRAAKHHEGNAKFRWKFNKDVESFYQAIPCNPFEMASLSSI